MNKIAFFVVALAFNTLVQSQNSVRLGLNFPFRNPELTSIENYMNHISGSGAQLYRQLTYADVIWSQVEPQDSAWNFSFVEETIETNSTSEILDIQDLVEIFPNPSSSFIHIKNHDKHQHLITFINEHGLQVTEVHVAPFQTLTFDVNTWATGFYFYKIDNKHQALKLNVNHF